MLDGSGRVPDFNPHHRTGGDAERKAIRGDQRISIHTTARVVTENDLILEEDGEFQSTPPHGW